jgi:WD40 repeat protein
LLQNQFLSLILGPIECFKAVGNTVVIGIKGTHFTNTLIAMDHNTGIRTHTFENEHWVKCCLFDGRRLITGHHFPYVIKSWTLASGGRSCTNDVELHGHQGAVSAIQFQNHHLLSASKEDHIKIWNVDQNVCVRVLDEQKHVSGLQFQMGRLISWSDLHGSLTLWERVAHDQAP